MELKVECGCGQNYAFDVEPVGGLMPFKVTCPSCGMDGTATANDILTSTVPTPARASQRVRVATPAPLTMMPPPMPSANPKAPAALPPKPVREARLGLGILGAFLGAALGAGLMYGFFLLTNFRFPLIGVGTGVLTGYGARLLGRGRDQILGGIAGAFSLVAVCGVLYLMYGEVPMFNIISMVVTVFAAYRIAA